MESQAKTQLHNFSFNLKWSKNRGRRQSPPPPLNEAKLPSDSTPPMSNFPSANAGSTSQIEQPKESVLCVPDELLEQNFVTKTWNLRPRRPRQKQPSPNPAPRKSDAAAEASKAAAKKKKESKFSISLSREEIEKDFCSMTGSKPPKKPKKRAKAVQKQLDNIFPGMHLKSVTPDAY